MGIAECCQLAFGGSHGKSTRLLRCPERNPKHARIAGSADYQPAVTRLHCDVLQIVLIKQITCKDSHFPALCRADPASGRNFSYAGALAQKQAPRNASARRAEPSAAQLECDLSFAQFKKLNVAAMADRNPPNGFTAGPANKVCGSRAVTSLRRLL